MLGYINNEYLAENTSMVLEYQMLFYQKMKELLHMYSGISYSYKIHNSYTILQELLDAIIDYERNKINGMIVEEIRKEAKKILEGDIVIKFKNLPLYETIKEEVKEGLRIDKGSGQSIAKDSICIMNNMKESIKQLFQVFKPIDYFKESIILTKLAIDNNDGEEIIKLCPMVVSSSLMIGRTISGMYKSLEVIFENKEYSFDVNWRRWSNIILRVDSKYRCFVKLDASYSSLVQNEESGSYIRQQYITAKHREYIDENTSYYAVRIEAPASDLPAIYNKAYSEYRDELSVIGFATAKVDNLEKVIIAYDEHNNSFIKLEQKDTKVEYVYKPYNQYKIDIDNVVKKFVKSLNADDYAKVIATITNVCNFEADSNEYRFLLFWSSLEALFRSAQYESAIGAIKNVIPEIMNRRYVYYRLVDFIKDMEKAEVQYSYNSRMFIKKTPSDYDIDALFQLLKSDSEYQVLLSLCKENYVLLYYKCKDLRNMILNAGTIKNTLIHHKETLEFHLQRMYRVRNKFVHHAEVDKNIDVLYKHLLVYAWECIREMSYVSESRGIKSLEELYSYFRVNYRLTLKHLSDVNVPVEFKNIKEGYLI